jgi:polyhydroxybutyrate depolymerase
LQIHGDADRVIAFDGGKSFGNGAPYPSAESTVANWAKRDGCGAKRHADGVVDLDLAVPGAETTRESYDCAGGSSKVDVSLWRMHGSGHVPSVDARFTNAMLDFLLRHHK